MTDVSIASSDADATAAAAVEAHHTAMSGALSGHVERLVTAATAGGDAGPTRTELVSWCRRELVPHALAEEKTMYPAAHARPEGRLLVTGMLGEHTVITGLVEEVASARDDVRAAAAATALRVVFDDHLRKENELVLPLLANASDVSVAALLGGMHELLGGGDHHDDDHHDDDDHDDDDHDDDDHDDDDHAGHRPTDDRQDVHEGHVAPSGHPCACGEAESAGHPELDVRSVPHSIRHATVFGALEAVPPGAGLVLVAPHDPRPLLAQIDRRTAGAFTVTYLTRGPEVWRLELVRRTPA